MFLSHARRNGSLPIPCMSCLSHRCSVSLLNNSSLLRCGRRFDTLKKKIVLYLASQERAYAVRGQRLERLVHRMFGDVRKLVSLMYEVYHR